MQAPPCRYWEAGYCKHGADCQFAHGPMEGQPRVGGRGSRDAAPRRGPAAAAPAWAGPAAWSSDGYEEDGTLQNPLYKVGGGLVGR